MACKVLPSTYLCSIKSINPILPRSLQALFDNIALLRASVREPAPEREERDLQSSWAKVTEDLCMYVVSIKLCN